MRLTGRRRAALAALLALAVAAVAWRPALVAWKVSRGRQELAAGRVEPALALLQSAEALDSDRASTQFLLARTFRRLGDSAEFAARLERAGQLGHPTDALEREWILAQAQAGLMSEAAPHLGKLLTDPRGEGPEICAAFVNGYVRNYQFAEAARMLDAWQADFPNDPQPHVMRGRIHHRWQRLPETEQEFREALRLRPDDRLVRGLLARVLVDRQQYEQALELLDGLWPAAAGEDDLRLARAECLLPLGRQSEAREIFAELVVRSPANCQAQLGLAQVELWDGQPRDALARLELALAHCPRRLDIRHTRAQALALCGRREEAAREQQAVSAAQQALSRAFDLAGRLLVNPDQVDARLEIGRALLAHGDAAEGAGWLLTILEIEPDHAQAHRLLAEHYAALGDDQRAARHRRSAGTP